MPDPIDPSRPQPVINAARLGGLVSAAFVSVGGAYFVITQGISSRSLPVIGTSIEGAITALIAVAVYVTAVIHGKAAAAEVTPLSAPHDDRGRALVPVDEYGRHAAQPDSDEAWLADLREPRPDDLREPRVADLRGPVPPPTRQRIPEDVIPGKRLGRHINHDPRSLNFLVQPRGVSQTKVWERKIPILDQGKLGSCTGNAATGVLGSEPYFSALSAAQQKSLNEGEAVQLYSLATALDSYPGTYPPTDTGSDGLSVAKAAQKSGFISAYNHITSVDAAKTAILDGPFIVGTQWRSGMDTPDAGGLVHATGSVRGGHEYECIGYHADTDLFEFVNSWGEGWGLGGHFFYSAADLGKLLAAQGDATVFVPVGAPFPPQPPTPPGPPAPVPVPVDVTDWADRTLSRHWSSHADRAAAQDFLDWQKGTSS